MPLPSVAVFTVGLWLPLARWLLAAQSTLPAPLLCGAVLLGVTMATFLLALSLPTWGQRGTIGDVSTREAANDGIGFSDAIIQEEEEEEEAEELAPRHLAAVNTDSPWDEIRAITKNTEEPNPPRRRRRISGLPSFHPKRRGFCEDVVAEEEEEELSPGSVHSFIEKCTDDTTNANTEQPEGQNSRAASQHGLHCRWGAVLHRSPSDPMFDVGKLLLDDVLVVGHSHEENSIYQSGGIR